MKTRSFFDKIYQRLLALCVMLVTHLYALADDIEDDFRSTSILSSDMEDGEMMEGVGFHFSTLDWILVGLAVVSYFILYKMHIKKGCWYIIFYALALGFIINKCT